jgi:glycosyltransferase involved in cell wall biosynthesis
MSDIRLSIITPCRNAEQFILSCIDNVVSQNCTEIEHVIVDGASTDDTVRLIERRASKLPHLRWISEPDNGQSQAMNKGLAMARGEIIGFLNADDIYEPGTLHRALEIFSQLTAPSFVVGNCNLVLRSGRVIRRSTPKGLDFDSLLAGEVMPPLNPSSYFYHKKLHDFAGPFEEAEHNFMDMKMMPKILRHADVHYFDEHWGTFRLHPKSKTNQRWMQGGILSTIDGLMKDFLQSLPPAEQNPINLRRARVESAV